MGMALSEEDLKRQRFERERELVEAHTLVNKLRICMRENSGAYDVSEHDRFLRFSEGALLELVRESRTAKDSALNSLKYATQSLQIAIANAKLERSVFAFVRCVAIEKLELNDKEFLNHPPPEIAAEAEVQRAIALTGEIGK